MESTRGDVPQTASAAGSAPSRRLSVVIPTLNEEVRLPVLLDCLAAQTRQPDEVVVADAGSTDSTIQLANLAGARVVGGGLPAVARNKGANAATGDLLLFLDADVELESNFVERALGEFAERRLGITSAPLAPVEDDWRWRWALGVTRGYQRLVERVAPHGNGACMLVDRGIHERIGGFDESLQLAEDHDYARRASQAGTYGLLRGVEVRTSMRRLERTSAWRMLFMILYAESLVFFGVPIRHLPFEYDYRHDALPGERPRFGRLGKLGRRLRKPSTELHGDSLAFVVLLLLAAALAAWVMTSNGGSSFSFLPFVVAAFLGAPSIYVLARKANYERTYGEFLSTGVFVSDVDLIGQDGAVVARGGIDELAELHLIRGRKRMAELSRTENGRAKVLLEGLRGLTALTYDMDDGLYANVRHICARSDVSLVGILLRLGFTALPNPPALDVVNRVEKWVLMWYLNKRLGARRPSRTDAYRLVAMEREQFASEEFRARVAELAARLERQLERAALAG